MKFYQKKILYIKDKNQSLKEHFTEKNGEIILSKCSKCDSIKDRIIIAKSQSAILKTLKESEKPQLHRKGEIQV